MRICISRQESKIRRADPHANQPHVLQTKLNGTHLHLACVCTCRFWKFSNITRTPLLSKMIRFSGGDRLRGEIPGEEKVEEGVEEEEVYMWGREDRGEGADDNDGDGGDDDGQEGAGETWVSCACATNGSRKQSTCVSYRSHHHCTQVPRPSYVPHTHTYTPCTSYTPFWTYDTNHSRHTRTKCRYVCNHQQLRGADVKTRTTQDRTRRHPKRSYSKKIKKKRDHILG